MVHFLDLCSSCKGQTFQLCHLSFRSSVLLFESAGLSIPLAQQGAFILFIWKVRVPGPLEPSHCKGCGPTMESRFLQGLSWAVQIAQDNPSRDFPSLRLNFLICTMEELESIFATFPSGSNTPKVWDYLGFHISGQDLIPLNFPIWP